MSDYYHDHQDDYDYAASENPYSEPVISHQLRQVSVPPASRSVPSTRSRGSSRGSSRSGVASSVASTGTQVSYRTKKTSMGIFKKRQTTIDCGSFKKLQNG